MSKVLISVRQLEMLLKLQTPKYPILFSGEIAPIVNDILKRANASKVGK